MAPLLPKIERGIHELRFNTRAYRKLEPKNGWGGIASALHALDSIVGWFNGWNRG